MNIKEITLPDGWVIDKQIGNKLILKEVNPKLGTWKKCYDKLFSEGKLCFINEVSNIDYDLPEEPLLGWINVFPKGYGHSMLALMQLLVCYKAWIGNWEPDWLSVKSEKFYIGFFSGYSAPIVRETYEDKRILVFPTEGMATDFMETFKDLIKEAKPLL